MDTKLRKQIGIYLTFDLWENLRDLANVRGIKVPELLEELIRAELERITSEEKLAMAVLARAKKQYRNKKSITEEQSE